MRIRVPPMLNKRLGRRCADELPALGGETFGGIQVFVHPVMRAKLRRAIFELIESHDTELAKYVGEGSLALDSYKEYIELFAHSLKQTMGTREGVAYLLQACGFELNKDDINLTPETRWKVQR